MMPLWMTATLLELQSRCGCAFASEGRPCVAQRVWPKPVEPASGSLVSRSASRPSLPSAFEPASTPWASMTAMPALS
jgi:hypothetical protein